MGAVDLFAIVLGLAVAIGCINYFWVRLQPAIGMLLGSLFVAGLIATADRALHGHVVPYLREALDEADLPHFFLDGVLALLLFAASLHVDVGELKRRRRTILLLATASVILSTVIFGYGLWYLCLQTAAPLPLIWCVVLGAILAPTDAVVVEDLLRKAGLPPNLRAAIVGESLFNDGAGVVLFLLTIGITEGEVVHIGHGEVLGALTRAIAGGALLGIIAGWLAALLMRRIADDGLQLLISLALVLGCYRLAILADLSGPIAVVSAGLCLGSPSPPFGMTPDTRRVLMSFWSLLNALLNTMLFLFMGLQIIDLSVTATQWIAVLIAVPLALVARFVSVFVPFTLTRRFAGETLRATTVLTWAGLRGGISIALALTLPDTPWRTQLLLVTYAVVIFTIVAQGLSFERVLHAVYPNRVPA